jgi:hypothetical protein
MPYSSKIMQSTYLVNNHMWNNNQKTMEISHNWIICVRVEGKYINTRFKSYSTIGTNLSNQSYKCPKSPTCTSMAIFLFGYLHFPYFFIFFATLRSPIANFSKPVSTMVYSPTFPMDYRSLKDICNLEPWSMMLLDYIFSFSIKVTFCSNDQVNVNVLLV